MKQVIIKNVALLLMCTALTGCLGVKGLLEKAIDEGDDNGGGEVAADGKNAVGLPYVVKTTLVDCDEDTDAEDCKNGKTERNSRITGGNLNRRKVVVTTNADGSKASATVDGQAWFTDVDQKDGYTGVNGNSEAEYGDGDNKIEVRKVAGRDEFFFFDVRKTTRQVTADGAEYTGESIKGVGGTLAPSSKVKTATYNGKAAGSIEKINAAGDEDVYFSGDSEMSANLETKKLNTKLTVTKAKRNIENNNGPDPDEPEFLGATVDITGADISGSEFKGGTVIVKNQSGATIQSFGANDVGNTGGFFGDDAEHLAGSVTAVTGEPVLGENGEYVLFDAEYWGTRDDAPATQ